MSQITRCPSCSTTFKVVADQLRISEGWVRCGQCKEVFDAAAHLLVAEAGHLLPEMSFEPTGTRWAAPAKKAPEPARVWGSARQAAVTASTLAFSDAAAPSLPSHPLPDPAPAAPPSEKPPATEVSPVRSAPAATDQQVQQTRSVDELPVPARTIPSFLTPAASDEGAERLPDWGLEPASPYGWRTRERVNTPEPMPPSVSPGGAVSAERELPANAVAHGSPVPSAAHAPHALDARPSADVSPKAVLQAGLDGYELPMPELRGSEWPESEGLEGSEAGGEVERQLPMLDAAPSLPRGASAAGPGQGLLVAESVVESRFASEDADESDDSVERVDRGKSRGKALSLGSAKQAVRTPKLDVDEDDLEDDSPDAPEPGFVRSARRRAFWSRPAMRAAMALFALVLVLGLAAQMALRERDYWAARFPVVQPLLVAMCAPWHCTTAAPRQIADVVIDSSSFTKSRADTYQLSVTLKSKSDTPVAMPAMELTLTDAQDQPVLRKVLHASDIAAPAALAPRGDWSVTLSISLSGSGSRVAGYRLLAFYP